MRIAVIGAGMAGLACARALKDQGLSPRVFDKGKGPAGRMASKRLATPLGEASFDMGAQYFTVQSPIFAEVVADWLERGLAAPWPEAGAHAWVGTPAMASPLKAMAQGLDIQWNAFVAGLSQGRDGWRLHLKEDEHGPFDAVAVALPAEQATPFLALNAPDFLESTAQAHSEPCWTGLFAFDAPLSTPRSLFRDSGLVGWACRNSAKPGRRGPETWVVQASADWSRTHLEDEPDGVLYALQKALLDLTEDQGVEPVASAVHRWRFAKSTGLGLVSLWNPVSRLGVCGDWVHAPRVESAWLSGRSLADQMVDETRLRQSA